MSLPISCLSSARCIVLEISSNLSLETILDPRLFDDQGRLRRSPINLNRNLAT